MKTLAVPVRPAGRPTGTYERPGKLFPGTQPSSETRDECDSSYRTIKVLADADTSVLVGMQFQWMYAPASYSLRLRGRW